MKHCHFTHLCNELPFLKQKLPFLYDNFDQLIFYDLNIYAPYSGGKISFSTDGSHEYIQDFPDPDNKITLIERKDISSVGIRPGVGTHDKRRMYIVASAYVRDDMDAFWDIGADEFFYKDAIEEVEGIFNSDKNVNSIYFDVVTFVRDYRFMINPPISQTKAHAPDYLAKVARHKKGNVYGHGDIGLHYKNLRRAERSILLHFTAITKKRVLFKLSPPERYILDEFWDAWNGFDESKIGDEVYGYPYMHMNPLLKIGIQRFKGEYPDYMNLDEMPGEK